MSTAPLRSLLAIETSTPVTRVAVVDVDSGRCLAEAEAAAERHSSNVLRLCSDVVARAGANIGALAAIACGAGPGSFTGLRVGLAVAKGLAMPASVPLVLVSSLASLAWDMRAARAPGEALLPCIDAGKGQIYAALFAPDERDAGGGDLMAAGDVTPAGAPWALVPDALVAALPAEGRIAFAGPGALRYRAALEAGLGARGRFVDVAGPTALALAALALPRVRRGDFDDLATAVPAYGRAPDITRPKPRAN